MHKFAVFLRSNWKILHLAEIVYTTSGCDGCDKYQVCCDVQTTHDEHEIIKSSSQSQSEWSLVVVVEKDSPAASVAVQAAQEYLDKNQGAKVGKRMSWISFEVIEKVIEQKSKQSNVGFFWKK